MLLRENMSVVQDYVKANVTFLCNILDEIFHMLTLHLNTKPLILDLVSYNYHMHGRVTETELWIYCAKRIIKFF